MYKSNNVERINNENMTIEEIEKYLTDNFGSIYGNQSVSEGIRHGYELALRQLKENELLHSVRFRFNIPNSEVNFAYYSDKAYLDELGWYMKDDNSEIQRPDVKYLEVDTEY